MEWSLFKVLAYVDTDGLESMQQTRQQQNRTKHTEITATVMMRLNRGSLLKGMS